MVVGHRQANDGGQHNGRRRGKLGMQKPRRKLICVSPKAHVWNQWLPNVTTPVETRKAHRIASDQTGDFDRCSCPVRSEAAPDCNEMPCTASDSALACTAACAFSMSVERQSGQGSRPCRHGQNRLETLFANMFNSDPSNVREPVMHVKATNYEACVCSLCGGDSKVLGGTHGARGKL
jgi:hypothetical protein